jgi:hypothetical protein
MQASLTYVGTHAGVPKKLILDPAEGKKGIRVGRTDHVWPVLWSAAIAPGTDSICLSLDAELTTGDEYTTLSRVVLEGTTQSPWAAACLMISRNHASFTLDAGGWTLTDPGSTNGTQHGVLTPPDTTPVLWRVRRMALCSGEYVTFGGCRATKIGDVPDMQVKSIFRYRFECQGPDIQTCPLEASDSVAPCPEPGTSSQGLPTPSDSVAQCPEPGTSSKGLPMPDQKAMIAHARVALNIVDRLDTSLTKIESLEEQLEMERQQNKNLKAQLENVKIAKGLVTEQERKLELALDKSKEELARANAELSTLKEELESERTRGRHLKDALFEAQDKSKADLADLKNERAKNCSECVGCKRKRQHNSESPGEKVLFSEDDSSLIEDDSSPPEGTSSWPYQCCPLD